MFAVNQGRHQTPATKHKSQGLQGWCTGRTASHWLLTCFKAGFDCVPKGVKDQATQERQEAHDKAPAWDISVCSSNGHVTGQHHQVTRATDVINSRPVFAMRTMP
jgi:hypothetical protein